jgi:diamine N-acetyltransferase
MEYKIHLETITWENYQDIIKLSVSEAQKNFITTNTYSLIHAYLYSLDGKKASPFGIYLDDNPIGFVMIGHDWYSEGKPSLIKNAYFIWRFMIDEKYQGKGYGKEALKLVLDFIKSFPYGKSDICWISYEPNNEAAKKLYASYGFVEMHEHYEEGKEMPAILKL